MRLSHFLQVISAGLAFALLLVSPAGATLEGAPPATVVRATLDTVFHTLDDQEMSKRTLAAHWKPLSPSERQDFVQLFKAFLSDQYAARIEGYAGERVVYLSERTVDGYAEVRTRLVSDKLDFPMDYRLTNKGGTWYAYDVIVDGVSLVMNYRSQFGKIIGESSFQELLHRLRERRVKEEKVKT